MSAVLKSLTSTDAEAEEWRIRCDMAAVFRVSARLGWNEQIGNHNSIMLPGERPLFLINPRGYLFQELTASSLIVCDLDGKVIRGKGELRKVAFHIHARIHLHNPQATCVMHVHPRWLTALSLLEDPEFRPGSPQQHAAERRGGCRTGTAIVRRSITRKGTGSPRCSATRPSWSWAATA